MAFRSFAIVSLILLGSMASSVSQDRAPVRSDVIADINLALTKRSLILTANGPALR